MITLGLTGSIGMGKTTTAAMFAAQGAPVFNADATVHQLYGPGGAAVPLIAAAFPDAVRDGEVDRDALARQVVGRPEAMARLEALVHPLVGEARARFLDEAQAAGVAVAVLDIPLLFETGRRDDVDAVVVVSAGPEVQRARVLARPGMTVERFQALLARQTPDAEKRARADFVVDTGHGLEAADAEVRRILAVVNHPQFQPPARLADRLEAPH